MTLEVKLIPVIVVDPLQDKLKQFELGPDGWQLKWEFSNFQLPETEKLTFSCLKRES